MEISKNALRINLNFMKAKGCGAVHQRYTNDAINPVTQSRMIRPPLSSSHFRNEWQGLLELKMPLAG